MPASTVAPALPQESKPAPVDDYKQAKIKDAEEKVQKLIEEETQNAELEAQSTDKADKLARAEKEAAEQAE